MNNDEGVKPPRKRPYRSPRREAAAAQTKEAIVCAAKQLFEEQGWVATTVGSIATAAGVSQKTVEALFGTKGALLRASVEYAIRGDIDPQPMPQRAAVARMEAVPTAAAMLDLHAAHVRAINERSARLAWAVEQAAAADPAIAKQWQQMNHNRAFGVRWATETLLQKRGRKRGLTRRQIETAIWVALDWGTYRTLTEHARLTPDEFEAWLRRYYKTMLIT